MLRRGKWQDRQLISDTWIKTATTRDGPGNVDYGNLWWLNSLGRTWTEKLDFNREIFVLRRLENEWKIILYTFTTQPKQGEQ